jgi:hypothetical protein
VGSESVGGAINLGERPLAPAVIVAEFNERSVTRLHRVN